MCIFSLRGIDLRVDLVVLLSPSVIVFFFIFYFCVNKITLFSLLKSSSLLRFLSQAAHSSSTRRIMPTVNFKPGAECLHLTDDEKRIFSLLRECCKALQLDVTLRVAGGWVRDKVCFFFNQVFNTTFTKQLLGLECQDCDIAIDRMMGHEFAERLRTHLLAQRIPTSAFGIIQANPDRSKHLETATLTIYGYPIDFVNLRAESYSHDSRIPRTVVFGSPIEDALRRDITINALFYNIHTEEVEDFSGLGFADLQAGLVRTPLVARETLLDDPLRLLRVVRFATRFQFHIVDELREAIRDAQVDRAFRDKISRERVGIELDKILRDQHSLAGMLLLAELGVFNLVFDIPPNLRSAVDYIDGQSDSDARMDSCEQLPRQEDIQNILATFKYLDSNSQLTGEERRLSLLCHCLLPYANRNPISSATNKSRPEPLPAIIVRESLKFTNADIQDVTMVLTSLPEVSNLLLQGLASNRLTFGLLLRRLGRVGRVALHVATSWCHLEGHLSLIDALVRYCSTREEIRQAGLEDVYRWRAILTGIEIQQIVGVGEGRLVGRILTQLIEWQIMTPQLTKEEAIQRIKEINWASL